MKKFAAIVCTTLALLAAPAFVQAAALDPAAEKATRALLDAMGSRQMVKEGFAQMGGSAPAMIFDMAKASINGNPRLTAAQKTQAIALAEKKVPEVAALVVKSLQDPTLIDEIVEAMVPLYATRFSAAEIEQIAAFYRTPVGVKMLAAMPQIMNESMQTSQKIMLPRMGKLMQEAAAAATAK